VALELPEDAFVDAKGAPYAGELFIGMVGGVDNCTNPGDISFEDGTPLC
jgi:hypothetical protein